MSAIKDNRELVRNEAEKRGRNWAWLQENVTRLIEGHSGEWVLITDPNDNGVHYYDNPGAARQAAKDQDLQFHAIIWPLREHVRI